MILYTWPDCSKCIELKEILNTKNITFEEKTFDIDTQTDFIMNDIFLSPPIVVVEGKVFNFKTARKILTEELPWTS